MKEKSKAAKRTAGLDEIYAVIPAQELTSILLKGRQTGDNDEEEIVPMELRPQVMSETKRKPWD